MTFDEFVTFLDEARQHGFISEPVCATHYGIPNTPDEEARWEAGYDPCALAVRIWEE